MTYTDAANVLVNTEREKTFGEYLRMPIIAPELDSDILEYLKHRSKPGNPESISVFDFSSNSAFSIIWIHKNGGTYADYVKEYLD